MTIKSIILGSAAALVAVSGARAADAVIMAEPEPVEYVRVCDAYGAGFFYIPGTETCLQISGYVWYQIGATSDDGLLSEAGNYNFFAGDGWNKSTRARINFDARSQTEWGTLRAYARIQADWGTPNDGPASFDQAFIDLGGLRMGYTESAWAETVNVTSSFGSHSWNGMWYGYQQRHLIQYNFASAAGIFGTISLEDDTLEGEGYIPDIVGVIGYEQAWGAVWLRAGYDESYGAGLDGFGVSAGTQINIGSAGSSLRLVGYYADGDHAYGTQGPTYKFGGLGNSEWSILGSYYHQFTPNFAASVAAQYFNNFYEANSDVDTSVDGFSAEVSVVWTPVTNFEIRSEIQYDDVDGLDGVYSGYLRFTRYF
ncbi:MAG: porin [Rhizobiaceae bacterium]|nr:porin [Rhizobiaceae bacterium]MCV0405377.1 porin [Rhizobiaceae bacterium]